MKTMKWLFACMFMLSGFVWAGCSNDKDDLISSNPDEAVLGTWELTEIGSDKYTGERQTLTISTDGNIKITQGEKVCSCSYLVVPVKFGADGRQMTCILEITGSDFAWYNGGMHCTVYKERLEMTSTALVSMANDTHIYQRIIK